MKATELQSAVLASTARKYSPQRLSELTRGVTRLFLASTTAKDVQVDLFDDVLQRLIEKIETRALVELAQQLATERLAPPKTMQVLAAHGDISVAGPVLEHSERLTESDLLKIIEARPQPHLLAISKRREIPETITDALVARGETPVLHSVAENPGAHFSDSGFNGLANYAVRDEELAVRIARRQDVPRHIFCRLVVQATEHVRQRLLQLARPELHAHILRVLDEVSGKLADELPGQHDYSEATRRLLQRYHDRALTEADIVEIVFEKDVAELIVALALMSELADEHIASLIDQDNPEHQESIVTLCRALKFEWSTTEAILLLTCGKRANDAFITEACAQFSAASPAMARRVLESWKSRAM